MFTFFVIVACVVVLCAVCAFRSTANETSDRPLFESVESRLCLSVSSLVQNMQQGASVDDSAYVVTNQVTNAQIKSRDSALKAQGFRVIVVNLGDGRNAKVAHSLGFQVLVKTGLGKADKALLLKPDIRKVVDGVSIILDGSSLKGSYITTAFKNEVSFVKKTVGKSVTATADTVTYRHLINFLDFATPTDYTWASYATAPGVPFDMNSMSMSDFTHDVWHDYNWLHSYDTKGNKPIVFTLSWPTSSDGSQRTTPKDQADFFTGVADLKIPFVVAQAFDGQSTRSSSALNWGVNQSPQTPKLVIDALKSADYFSKKIPAGFSSSY